MSTINIGIVGAGRMGTLHASNFENKIKNCNVLAVADNNKKSALELSEKVNAESYTNYNKMLQDKNIDAICISTPIQTHKEIILKAIQYNKHIFCEKPLTLDVNDAKELAEKVEEKKIVFQLAFMRRFDEDFLVARNRIMKGDIGTPVYIRSTGRDPGLPPVPGWGSKPEICGDISFELCSHDYDSVRWLMNDEITKVYGQANILSSKEVAKKCGGHMINDTITVSLELSKGAFGSIDGLLNIKYGYDARVEVVGDEGVILIGSINHNNVFHGNDNKVISVQSSPSFIDRFHYAYINEANHFINCVLKNEKPKVNIWDGLEAVKIADHVNKSIKLGEPVFIGG